MIGSSNSAVVELTASELLDVSGGGGCALVVGGIILGYIVAEAIVYYISR